MSITADEISTQVRSYDARLRLSILAGDVVTYMRREEKELATLFKTWQTKLPAAFPTGLFIYKFVKHWFESDSAARASPDFCNEVVGLMDAFDKRQRRKMQGPGPMEGVQATPPPLQATQPAPAAPAVPESPPITQLVKRPAPKPKPKPKSKLVPKGDGKITPGWPRAAPEPAPAVPGPSSRPAVAGPSSRPATTQPAPAVPGPSSRPAPSQPAQRAHPAEFTKSFADINDASEDEHYVPSSEEEGSPQPPPTKKEGKGRRDAVGTGYALEPACEKCVIAGRICQEEVGGGACVTCFQLKYKCLYSHVKGKVVVKPEKRKKITVEELKNAKAKEDEGIKKEKKGRTKKVAKGKRKAVEAQDDGSEVEVIEAAEPMEVSDDPKAKRKRPARKSAKTTAQAAPAPAPAAVPADYLSLTVFRSSLSRLEHNLYAALDRATDEDRFHRLEIDVERVSRGLAVLLQHQGLVEEARLLYPALPPAPPLAAAPSAVAPPPAAPSAPAALAAAPSTPAARAVAAGAALSTAGPAAAQLIVAPAAAPSTAGPAAARLIAAPVAAPAEVTSSGSAMSISSSVAGGAPPTAAIAPQVTVQPPTPQTSQKATTPTVQRARSPLALTVPASQAAGPSGMRTRARSRTASPMDEVETPTSPASSSQSGTKRKAVGAEDERQDKRRR